MNSLYYIDYSFTITSVGFMEFPPTVFGYHFEMYYSFRKLLYTIFLLKSRIIFQQKLPLISDQL